MDCPYWHEIADHGAQEGVEEFYGGKYSGSGGVTMSITVNKLDDFKDNDEEFAV